jgi:hypothetical protein
MLIYAAPPIYASLWHLGHGSLVECRGFVVPVPPNWWAKDQGCSFTTASPEYTFGIHRPVQLFVRNPIDPAQDATWESDVIARLRRHRIEACHSTNLTVGGIPATCLEFRTPDSAGGSNIACNIHGHMTVVLYYYDDDPKTKSEFYQILAKIRPAGFLR